MLKFRYSDLLLTAARNTVEAEIVRAQEDFERANPSKYPSDIRSDGKPYLHYIHRVVLAFAREACKLGSDGTWSIDRIRVECRLFASSVIRGVLDFKASDARWEPFFDGPLERLKNDDFGNGPEFAPYRQLLLGVAESSPEESDWAGDGKTGRGPKPELIEQEQPAGPEPIDREAIYLAAQTKHPEWANRGFAKWCRDNGFANKEFRKWLKRTERSDKPGTLKYPDDSPRAQAIVAALLR